MTKRARTLSLSLAIAAPFALATAAPALASGGSGGGSWTCSAPTVSTLPGIVTSRKITVPSAGTAVLKRDNVNDGLIVGKVVPTAGWSKTVEIAAGPKVAVKFQRDSHYKVELEAAQSTAYYGPTVLVTETKTCTR